MQPLKWIRRVWIWVLFFFIALFLLSSQSVLTRPWNPFERILVEVASPFQNAINKTFDVIKDFWLNYFALVDVRKENLQFRKQLDTLIMENNKLQELVRTHSRLEELFQFKQNSQWPALAVQVIGHDPTGWFKSVMIDKGTKAGLKMNMPVVNAKGAVGRLVSVSPHYAKVLLIIDQNSAVDCIIQRSRENGIVKGINTKESKLDFVLKTSDVVTGDKVVTSGLGGVFPKGIPVGEVVEVKDTPSELFKDVKVRLFVDFSKLEELLVILKEGLLSGP